MYWYRLEIYGYNILNNLKIFRKKSSSILIILRLSADFGNNWQNRVDVIAGFYLELKNVPSTLEVRGTCTKLFHQNHPLRLQKTNSAFCSITDFHSIIINPTCQTITSFIIGVPFNNVVSG